MEKVFNILGLDELAEAINEEELKFKTQKHLASLVKQVHLRLEKEVKVQYSFPKTLSDVRVFEGISNVNFKTGSSNQINFGLQYSAPNWEYSEFPLKFDRVTPQGTPWVPVPNRHMADIGRNGRIALTRTLERVAVKIGKSYTVIDNGFVGLEGTHGRNPEAPHVYQRAEGADTWNRIPSVGDLEGERHFEALKVLYAPNIVNVAAKIFESPELQTLVNDLENQILDTLFPP